MSSTPSSQQSNSSELGEEQLDELVEEGKPINTSAATKWGFKR